MNRIQNYPWLSMLIVVIASVIITSLGFKELPIYILFGIAANLLLTPYFAWFLVAPLLFWAYLLIVDVTAKSVTVNKIAPTFLILALIIVAALLKLIIVLINKRRVSKYAKDLSPLSDTQIFFSEELMKNSGLSDNEIKFFKSDVNKRYRSYLYLRTAADTMEKIVPNYQRSIELIQGIFRELAETPQLMLSMDDFLYKHLDEYTRVTRSVMNLQDNLIKEKEDTQLVEKASEKLVAMEKIFEDDYKKVTENEREALRNI